MLISRRKLFWPLCAALVLKAALPGSAEESGGLDPAKLNEITATIEAAIENGRMPGAIFWLERNGDPFSTVLGNRAVEPEEEELTLETIFDLASLTKVIATTSSVALLLQREELDLDAPVSSLIPEFGQEGKDGVTVRHLLTHTSGLRAGISRPKNYTDAIHLACVEKLQSEPGEKFLYSDINFILLGEIVQRVSGSPLHEFSREEIFEPLGMFDSCFLPDPKEHDRIAPTERTSSGMLRGEVHDPTSRAMGGVAGHAGLFSTVEDLARFARMMLNEGELDGARVFEPETVKLITSVQTPDAVHVRRGFGWDIDSQFSGPRGSHFPIGSYGHTGWTGTSIWIDPYSQTFWILLTSRVHPDGKGNVVPLRRVLGTLAAEAVAEFDFENVAGALSPRERTEGE